MGAAEPGPAATDDQRLAHLLLKEEITDLLHHEADLLDEGRYEEWLEQVADDVTYVMPLQLNVAHDNRQRAVTRPGEDVCWIDEGKTTLTQRVEQLRTGIHWAEEPLSRVSHLVSNIRLLSVEPDSVEPAEVEVGCRFLVYRNRVAAETDLWVGRRTDRWRQVDGDWRLIHRCILLDQNVLLAKNLTVLL